MKSTTKSEGYVGRFAPSPTGPLHAGSLVAAVGSYLDARHHHGQWLLRIDDLDPPRTVSGADDAIRAALERHGLHWDGAVLYQSTRTAAYVAALEVLRRCAELFYCTCSRLQLAAQTHRYPGTCRARATPPAEPAAIRLRVPDAWIHVTDLLQGDSDWNLARDPGDFVVRRRDGFFAYQMAVVVDDAAANITHVVRGADLLDNTARQQYLQTLLLLPTPRYLHLPLLRGADGMKLSKQHQARALSNTAPSVNLARALAALGHEPPAELIGAPPHELLSWATKAWQRAAIPRMLTAADGIADGTATGPADATTGALADQNADPSTDDKADDHARP